MNYTLKKARSGREGRIQDPMQEMVRQYQEITYEYMEIVVEGQMAEWTLIKRQKGTQAINENDEQYLMKLIGQKWKIIETGKGN